MKLNVMLLIRGISLSPSLRGRGLKFGLSSVMLSFTASPSLRGRGLKLITQIFCSVLFIVALFTRAWIEITSYSAIILIFGVALFTRAWIEIAVHKHSYGQFKRRPLYEGVD